SEPDMRTSVRAVEADEHSLRLHVLRQTGFTDAALLLTGHRRLVHAGRVIAVHVHLTGLDGARHAQRAIDALRPDRGCQSIGQVMAKRNGFRLRVEREHGEHRAEYLFLRDAHRTADAAKDRRLDEIATPK